MASRQEQPDFTNGRLSKFMIHQSSHARHEPLGPGEYAERWRLTITWFTQWARSKASLRCRSRGTGVRSSGRCRKAGVHCATNRTLGNVSIHTAPSKDRLVYLTQPATEALLLGELQASAVDGEAILPSPRIYLDELPC